MPTFRNDLNSDQLAVTTGGATATVPPGESIQTYQILGSGWTKTSDEPYDRLTLVEATVAAGSSVSGLLQCTVIVCTAGASGLKVCPNSAGNPGGLTLPGGLPVEIDNPGTIEALYVVGTGGTVFVQGLR